MSEEIKDYKIISILEAQSIITHMKGIVGNEAIIAREDVYTENGIMSIPYISGNSIRHNCIRRFGMLWLIDALDLRGKLNLQQLNYLMHGGNLTQSSGNENTKIIAEMQLIFPLLRLLGGSLPNQIIAGSLIAIRGILICNENKKYIENMLPGDWNISDIILDNSEKFITDYQYTRGDAKKEFQQDLINEKISEGSQLMIFNGQGVMKGSLWMNGYIMQGVSELELGALLLSLQLWEENGGILGGQGAKGHGRFKQNLIFEEKFNVEDIKQKYKDHVIDHKEAATEWLGRIFG